MAKKRVLELIESMKRDENGNLIELSLRGYELLNDTFYVKEIIHSCDENDCDFTETEDSEYDEDDDSYVRKRDKYFADFKEYYEFLEGDIYTQACYIGWKPEDSLLETFHIDKSRLNRKPLVTRTIEDYSWSLAEEIKVIHCEKAARGRHLHAMVKRLCGCREPKDIQKALNHFMNKDFYGKDFQIALSQYFAEDENAEALLLESARQQCIPDLFINVIMAFCKDPVRLADSFEPTYDYSNKTREKHKREARIVAEALADYEAHTVKVKKSYDIAGYFIKTLYIQRSDKLYCYKYEVFKDFQEFVQAVEYDLTDCDLSDCILEKIFDPRDYLTNEKTVLPLTKKTSLQYAVMKEYRDKTFYISQEWVDEQGGVRFREKFEFVHFAEYYSFLCGDLHGSDFRMMPTAIYSRVLSTGIDLSGVLPPERFPEMDVSSDFNITTQNEIETKFALESVRPKEELQPSDSFTMANMVSYRNDVSILYISDIHLDHILFDARCQSTGDVHEVLMQVGKSLEESYFNTPGFNKVVFIDGDISHDPHVFQMFINMEFRFLQDAIIIPGNHELWAWSGLSVEEIVRKYAEMSSAHVVNNEILMFSDYDLQNSNYLCAFSYDYPVRIPYEEVMELSSEALRERLQSARMIVLAGIGFSGCNPKFNAKNGIYRNTLTRSQEIQESNKFAALYKKFLSVTKPLADRIRIVVTHMPLKDWSRKAVYEEGVIYISGHDHRNYFFDDGATRVFSDNQNGYHGRHLAFKYIPEKDVYDTFVYYTDGIYEISKPDYIAFNRGKKMKMQMNREFDAIYMLKKNGYYCFLAKLASGRLSILNGARTKGLKGTDVHFYYEQMDKVIEKLSKPLDKYSAIQKKVSDAVKAIGGSGHIHGCIVDISFYDHIYVNPFDLTLRPYHATDMVWKYAYDTVPSLLEEHCPALYERYNGLLKDGVEELMVLPGQSQLTPAKATLYLDTDIYKASREISKMQKLYNNVLTIWDDAILELEDGSKALPKPEDERPERKEQQERMVKSLAQKGTVSDVVRKKYMNMTRRMNCGLMATVIEYHDNKNITIRFEDGLIRHKVRADKFMEGKVAHIPDSGNIRA